MGGGTDESNGASFEVREENVLLGFVEAVDLVDEEDGRLIAKGLVGSGGFDFGPNLGDIGFDSVEGFEARSSGACDDVSEGRFASARRPVEDEGGEAIRNNGPTKKFALGKDVFLAGDFLKGPRSHAGSEGLSVVTGHQFGPRFVVRNEK